ncbi:unnamed protein product [marine sediment metagenome]|uniref:Uncharacterized protein n=1 Tax=marine sediment metagenome TaxID=412755 RepID=X1IMB9_9ZZZZ
MGIYKPDLYTKDMKRIDVYVTENLSLKDKEIVHHFSRRSEEKKILTEMRKII